MHPLIRNFVEKLKEPLLPAHLANWVETTDVCGFNRDEGVCSFSTLVGVVAFLMASIFVVVEIQWEKVGSYHRWIYAGELVASGIWALLFFIVFCMLASNWVNTPEDLKRGIKGNANVAIISSFASFCSWSALAYFSYKGYKEDDLGSIERLGTSYIDPVTSGYHQGV